MTARPDNDNEAGAEDRNRGGRPVKWNDKRLWLLMMYVEVVKEASREGRIRHTGIETDKAACRLIAGPYPETRGIRDALGIASGTNDRTLANVLRQARERDQRGWASPDKS